MKTILSIFRKRKEQKLIDKINQILQFERDEKEFARAPTTNKAKDFWLVEWYNKAKKINELINGGQNDR